MNCFSEKVLNSGGKGFVCPTNPTQNIKVTRFINVADTKLGWLSRGPMYEVINTNDGSVVARWTFGAVIKDFSTKVSV